MVLGKENVTREPAEVTTEGFDILNQHCCMDGHVERSRYMDANRHLKYL